jgi:lipopolysaccharide transport system ATP-binding protein
MSDIAIRCEDIAKQYRIGERESYKALRDVITDAVKRPFQRLRQAERGSGRNGNRKPTIWALQHVSFEVRQGDVIGIIGRNGAGKSTVLKILSRITEPTRGYAEIHGRVGSLLEVGTGFHPELSGRENIFLNGAILGMKKKEISRKFDEIVSFAEVEKFIDTPVKRYSSGMYVRLAFAVAAHMETEILLVDEVLAVGDVQFQKKCLGKMGDVAKQGRTVLFVSHNMNAVEELCNRVILLDEGKITRDSEDVRSVLTQYLFASENERSSVWANDGNNYQNAYFYPERFSIVDANGQPLTGPVRNDSDMWVEIEAVSEHFDPALSVGYGIYSEDHNLLYWSYQTDRSPEEWPVLRCGRQRLRSRIPSNLLNEGTYRIELMAGLHFREWLFEPGPQIFLIIQGGLSESPYWIAKRPGLLAPVLRWEKLEPQRRNPRPRAALGLSPE